MSLSLSLTQGGPSALVDIIEDAPPQQDNTPVSMETAPMETEELIPDKKRKKQKQSKKKSGSGKSVRDKIEVQEDEERVGKTEEKEGDLNDLEFWLSKGDAPTPNKKKQVCVC